MKKVIVLPKIRATTYIIVAYETTIILLMRDRMKLSELKNNDKAVITKVKGRGAFRKRITEMGFIKGKEITVVKDAPLRDPVEYNILGYDVSLRKSEASLIEVMTEDEVRKKPLPDNKPIDNELLKTAVRSKSKTINVAFVGNPNSGKTTLFNALTGSNEHVGNYSGVTIDAKCAKTKYQDYTFQLVDLPGTYSLTPYSNEELYVRHHLLSELPDIVVNVVDASNLERNLYLTTQIIDMDMKVVIALNMFDELEKSGNEFDYDAFGKMVGIPMIPTVGSKRKGVKPLLEKIIDVYEDRDKTVRHIHINHGKEVEQSIHTIQDVIYRNARCVTDKISSRFLAIKLLEQDSEVADQFTEYDKDNQIPKVVRRENKRLKAIFHDESDNVITDAKYGFIAGALKETYTESQINRRRKTKMIDNIVTHRIFGFPIFLFFIWLMFQATFRFGKYPMNWIETGVQWLSSKIGIFMQAGPLKDLLIHGVLDGVGGVIVFLPNIVILFFFISILEDTGYMARAAFIMDKLMHKIGLHGKSFIPLIMGFGCNVPAIMATRTLESRNDRILTILINPFMSCSARLPVYLLFAGAFFPDNAGTVLFAIYFTGILAAIGVSVFFKKTLFRNTQYPFVMELPPYRVPTLRTTVRHMWHKASEYLKKMGGVILVAAIIIWALGYFPRNVDYSQNYDAKIRKIEKQYADNTLLKIKDSLVTNVKLQKEAERQSKSYIGKIGRFIEPVIRPLGFDWKTGVSILSGIAAKEVIVSTLGVLYQASTNEMQGNESLKQKLKNATYTSGNRAGQKVFNPVSALSLMLFILLYFPCIAVIITIKKETGSWKWSLFTALYTTTIAWVVSFIIYQVGSLLFLGVS